MWRDIAWQFLLPPNGLVTLAALACAWGVFVKRGSRWAAAIALGSLVLLALILTPPLTNRLIDRLERDAGPALTVRALQRVLTQSDPPRAIVVLGGGLRADSREADFSHQPTAPTLERLRTGAQLARASDLPILVTGGSVPGYQQSEAEIMARVLRQDFAVGVRWQENRSRNTAENAHFTARLLRPLGIERIVLVTHAYHMVRARAVFEAQGFRVTSAPAAFLSGKGSPAHWIRGGVFDDRAWLATHELIGWFWYAARGLFQNGHAGDN